jgi:uncharacterized membrane protein YfcA
MPWTEPTLWLMLTGLVGGLVFGVTGFAFGVVGSVMLHHTLPPAEVLVIIVVGGFVLNLSSLPRYRHLVDLRRAAPFMAGATLGIPAGITLLGLLQPATLRSIAALLILVYCGVALLWQSRRALRLQGRAAWAADAAIGTVGGVAGGVAGLGPLVPGVWYGLRGWSRDEQRGLAQAFGVYVQGLLLAALLVREGDHAAAWSRMPLLLPGMLLGAWVGARIFDRLPVKTFQRAVIVLCAFGAVSLLVRQWG